MLHPSKDWVLQIAKQIKPTNYLEIGVKWGQTFKEVAQYCENSYGIDPKVTTDQQKRKDLFGKQLGINILKITSDEFFRRIVDKNLKFDLIFIDGLHTKEQVEKDFNNSLKFLTESGFICIHDTNPHSKAFLGEGKCGDGWKFIFLLRRTTYYSNFELLTLPCEVGLTIIRKRKKQVDFLSYDEHIALIGDYKLKNG